MFSCDTDAAQTIVDFDRMGIELVANLVRESKALHTDATKMPYLDPEVKGRSLSGQMWAFIGDRDHPFDLFHFWPDHSAGAIAHRFALGVKANFRSPQP